MLKSLLLRGGCVVACSVAAGMLALAGLQAQGRPGGAAQGRNAVPIDLPGLSAEVGRIGTVLPTQSHVMADVSYQFSNLWFAGKAKNWPLAQFFLNETRNRVRWMIRSRPIVQDPDKNDVDLQGIFDAIDNDVWRRIKTAIDRKDEPQFEAEYKLGLDKGCYSCHKERRPPVPPPAGADPDAADDLHVRVDDLAAHVDALTRDGVRFRNRIETGPGGKQIQLEDPDGNPIELFEPAS